MDASAARLAAPRGAARELELSLPLRQGRAALGLGLARPAAGGAAGLAELAAGAAFIVDSAQAAAAPAALARMIGCFFFASAAGRDQARVTLRLELGGATAAARLARPAFEVERNGFGAAHVLYEDAALGLYVLELAPGRAIPAHFHRLMRESELVLDAGLMQQGRPVMPGDAFDWPLGLVHEYRNPTGAPRRILCIDRPRFIPDDEVVVPGRPELVPVRPACNYLA